MMSNLSCDICYILSVDFVLGCCNCIKCVEHEDNILLIDYFYSLKVTSPLGLSIIISMVFFS